MMKQIFRKPSHRIAEIIVENEFGTKKYIQGALVKKVVNSQLYSKPNRIGESEWPVSGVNYDLNLNRLTI